MYFGPLYNQIRHCCSAVIKMAFHGLRNRAPFSLSHLRPNKVSRLPHTTSHNMYVHLNMFENCCNHLLVARVGNDPTYCALQAHANPSQLPSHGPGFFNKNPENLPHYLWNWPVRFWLRSHAVRLLAIPWEVESQSPDRQSGIIATIRWNHVAE